MSTRTVDNPKIVSRDEWLAARKQLLTKEKQLTRERDAIAAERIRLWLVVSKVKTGQPPSAQHASQAQQQLSLDPREEFLAVCIGKFGKLFRANRFGWFHKTVSQNKGEMTWQQAKRETRKIRKGISR